jgi:hypothetical protein
VEETADHQRHRPLLLGGAPAHAAMVGFVNVNSADRIICSVFQRFTLKWKSRNL